MCIVHATVVKLLAAIFRSSTYTKFLIDMLSALVTAPEFYRLAIHYCRPTGILIVTEIFFGYNLPRLNE